MERKAEEKSFRTEFQKEEMQGEIDRSQNDQKLGQRHHMELDDL